MRYYPYAMCTMRWLSFGFCSGFPSLHTVLYRHGRVDVSMTAPLYAADFELFGSALGKTRLPLYIC